MSYMERLKKIVFNTATHTKLIPTLVGETGIGKTSIIEELGRDISKEVLIMNLSSIEASDFTGRSMTVNGVTQYAKPFFLDHRGILFLDEINRVVDDSVKASLHSLLLDRKVNGHVMPEGTLIVAAANIGNGYDVQDFDKSLMDRLKIIKVNPDLQSWYAYESSKRPSRLVDFLGNNAQLVQKFSFRRMSEANKYFIGSGTTDGLEYILNQSLVDLFKSSLKEKKITTKNVLEGNFNKEDISSADMTMVNLVCRDLSEKVWSSTIPKESLKSVKTFIENVRPECRITFFSGMKVSSDKEDLSKTVAVADHLQKSGFLTGDFQKYMQSAFEA